MSLLSSLFKTKKVNLTPDISYKSPSEINPQMYGSLSGLANKYMQGPGFGEGFLDRATSAPIKSREARFNEVEMPQLSSQLSSRGLARSAGPNLATDVITRAGQSKERDINDLISQFYVLNESQKKQDTQFGAGLGQNILSGDVSAQTNQAAASERLAGATAADARAREQRDTGLAGNIMQAGAQLAVPGLGGLSALTGKIPGMGGLSSLLSQAQGGMQNFNQQVGSNILGKDEMSQFLMAYMAMKGGR